MKHADLADNVCPVARTLNIVGDTWSLLIVRDARFGLKRFGEFQKSLGLAKNILADRLRTLTEAGILEREPVSEDSPYQEYVLTEKGRSLGAVVDAMAHFGTTHLKPASNSPVKSEVRSQGRRKK